MIDVDCAQTPLEVGETRILRVSGDAPFSITVGRVVNDPPPIGLRPGDGSEPRSLAQDEPFEITADAEFWSHHKGGLQIDIADAAGARRRLHINVRPKVKGIGSVMIRA